MNNRTLNRGQKIFEIFEVSSEMNKTLVGIFYGKTDFRKVIKKTREYYLDLCFYNNHVGGICIYINNPSQKQFLLEFLEIKFGKKIIHKIIKNNNGLIEGIVLERWANISGYFFLEIVEEFMKKYNLNHTS